MPSQRLVRRRLDDAASAPQHEPRGSSGVCQRSALAVRPSHCAFAGLAEEHVAGTCRALSHLRYEWQLSASQIPKAFENARQAPCYGEPDFNSAEEAFMAVKISIRPNGPYLVEGDVEVLDPAGTR